MVKNERKAGVILTYLNIFLSSLIMLFFTPFVIKILGQSEFGLYSLALSIMGYLTILDLGFGNAIIVFTSKFLVKNESEKQKTLYGTIFAIYLMMSILTIFMGLIFYNYIENIFSNSMNIDEIKTLELLVLILIFNVAISLPCNIFISILNAYEKFVFIRLISILKAVVTPFVLIIILLLGYKSVAMMLAITVLNILYFLSAIIYYKKEINISINITKFKLFALKIVASYSIFIFISIIVDQVNWNVGQFIIGAFLGAKEVSVYAIAILINSMFMMLSTAISGVFLPKISQMVASNSSNKILTDEMIKIGRLQGYIIFLVLFGFILFGKEFIIIWAGIDYLNSYYLTIIIMIPLAIPLTQNLGLSIIQAKNKFKFRALAALIVAIFSIILSVFLINIYGYFGVALSLGLSFFILNGVIINWYYHYKIELDMIKFWKNIVKNIFSTFVIFIIFLLIKNLFLIDQVLELILWIILFSIIYFLACYKISMNEYEKGVFLSLINKFQRIKA